MLHFFLSCFADTEQEKEFGRKNAKLKLFLAVQVPRSYKNIKTTAGAASKHCFLESQQFVVVCCSYDRTSTNSFKDCTFHCQLYLATNIEWIEHFTQQRWVQTSEHNIQILQLLKRPISLSSRHMHTLPRSCNESMADWIEGAFGYVAPSFTARKTLVLLRLSVVPIIIVNAT